VRVASAGRKTVVLEAHDDALDRPAVVAILRLGAATPAQITEFVEHARAVARIRSEHAARVLDIGELPDGCPFVAMDQLFGDDLAQVLADRGPLEPEAAVDLMLQALEALAAAHAVGILHREIQPGNLLLTPSRGPGAVLKVLDFRGTQATSAPSAYTAPEQVRDPAVLDARSDVWSVGAVLYELLSGLAPFGGGSPVAVNEAILAATPRDLAELRWEVPDALSEVVMRCLRRDPADRYADVDDLAVALAPFGSGAEAKSVGRAQEVLTRPPRTPPMIGKRQPDGAGDGGAGSISAQIVSPLVSEAHRSDHAWRAPMATLSSFPPVAHAEPSRPPPSIAPRATRWTRTVTLVAATFVVLGLAGTLSTRALTHHHAGAPTPSPAATPVPRGDEPALAPSAVGTPANVLAEPTAPPSASSSSENGAAARPPRAHGPTRRQILQSRQ
jgi:serine/threonine-protein kinase